MKQIESLVTTILSSKRNKRLVLLLTLVSFIVAIALIPTEIVKAKMLPGKNANNFTIYVDLKDGSSVYQTKQVTDEIVKILAKEKEVTDVEVFLGTGSPLDFAGFIKGSSLKEGENVAEIVVNLTKKHDRDEPSFLMVQRLRPVINKKVLEINNHVNIQMVEPPAGPPTLADVVAEVYGEDSSAITRLAKEVEKVLAKTSGLVDVDIISDDEYKKYQIVLNYERIKKSGLEISDVTDIVNLAFDGMVITTKNDRDSNTQIDLFVRLKQFNDKLEDSLSNLTLKNKNGDSVVLKDLVTLKEVNNNKTVYSKELKKMINVVATTDMVSQIYPLLDARAFMLENFGDKYEVKTSNLLNLEFIEKSSGEHLKLVWDGELKVTLDTFRDLGGAFIAALILIFLLMVVYYRNFALSGIVLLSSFLSIIGVIFGHLIMDIFTTHTFFLTATSLIGFISLIGISSRNALLLIDFAKLKIKEGYSKHEAIIEAATTRAKPIFLTAAAIILASMLLATDAVFGGLGVALIFGTMSAVIASLFVVPVLIDNLDEEVLLS